MNLLYIYHDGFFQGLEAKEYLLNSKYNIRFDESEKKLYIELNHNYIEGFWGNNVFDVMAIVGENGSGKTKLANCIMYVINQLGIIGASSNVMPFVIAFEDKNNDEMCVKVFVTDKYKNINVINGKKDIIDGCKKIDKFKMGYFTNALALDDYRYKKIGYIFDASVGGCINNSFELNYEMHYIDINRDKLINYFSNEIKDMLDFLYSDLGKNISIPFVLPKSIVISIIDYKTNLDYISKTLAEMSSKNEKILLYRNKKNEFLKETCDFIINLFGHNWKSYLIINLMLNLFKEICIPQTSSDKLEEEAIDFLGKINYWKKESADDAFSMITNLFRTVKNSENEDIVNVYIGLIHWFVKNESIIEANLDTMEQKWSLNLKNSHEIINELLEIYNKVNFSYPFLSFDFGLSTGELNFLKLFTKIAKLLSKESDGKRYVTNNVHYRSVCTNLLLYFDEADLSLHPKWQQKYLKWILDFITTFFESCTVQIIIATHSPIMLSDFPEDNVMYLWRGKEKKRYAERRKIKTFGNNIHNLFLDSFFLNDVGTMGAFAEKKINELADSLRYSNDINSETALRLIDKIGDDIIRNRLMQICNSKMDSKKEIHQEKMNTNTIDATIDLIRHQIRSLEKTIEELERIKGDKN